MENKGFFSSLAGFLGSATLTMKLEALTDGRIRVAMIPTPLNDKLDSALKEPICFTGTPAELDVEAIPHLETLGVGYKSIAETFAAAEAVQKQAKERATTAAASASKKGGASPATVKPTVTGSTPPATGTASEEAKGDGQQTPQGEGTATTAQQPASMFD